MRPIQEIITNDKQEIRKSNYTNFGFKNNQTKYEHELNLF